MCNSAQHRQNALQDMLKHHALLKTKMGQFGVNNNQFLDSIIQSCSLIKVDFFQQNDVSLKN